MTANERLSSLNEEETNELFGELRPRIHAYMLRRMTQPEDASDATSETLLVLWRRREDVPARASDAVPYAFGVARLVLKNAERLERRKHGRHVELDDDRLGGQGDPAETHWDLDLALARLRPADRELVTLVHWDGLPVAAAGASMGMRPAVAYRRHRNVLRQLLSLLESDEAAATLPLEFRARSVAGR